METEPDTRSEYKAISPNQESRIETSQDPKGMSVERNIPNVTELQETTEGRMKNVECFVPYRARPTTTTSTKNVQADRGQR